MTLGRRIILGIGCALVAGFGLYAVGTIRSAVIDTDDLAISGAGLGVGVLMVVIGYPFKKATP